MTAEFRWEGHWEVWEVNGAAPAGSGIAMDRRCIHVNKSAEYQSILGLVDAGLLG